MPQLQCISGRFVCQKKNVDNLKQNNKSKDQSKKVGFEGCKINGAQPTPFT